MKCLHCKKEFLLYIRDNPPENAEDLYEWLWKFHNIVNRRLGKKLVSLEESRAYYMDEDLGVCDEDCAGSSVKDSSVKDQSTKDSSTKIIFRREPVKEPEFKTSIVDQILHDRKVKEEHGLEIPVFRIVGNYEYRTHAPIPKVRIVRR